VSVDPKESHIDAYRGVSILTPNQHEAGWVQGRRVTDEASLMEVGWGLQQRLDAAAVLVTRGAGGMSLFERGGRYTHLPTVAREIYDVTGAGDTVVSVVALALAAGADFPAACLLANHAAGVVIREVGTATCTREQLLASLARAKP
jgi:rfaE bifunctional protein kinase chain/domain